MKRIETLTARAGLYIFYGLLAYMPLHILLSTWLGSSFGLLEFTKTAKDVVLIIGFACVLVSSIRQKWFSKLVQNPLTVLILAYAVFTLFLAMLRPVQQEAELLGVVYNLRFLVFFMYAVLLAHLFELKIVLKRSLQIVLSVGVFVALFGVIQYALLPDSALTHLGYARANGVLPAFFIDDKPDLERVMSTLRDPNSLGSYLIITGSLLGAALLAIKKRTHKTLVVAALAVTILCLFFSFSRSAWIGAVLAGTVFAAFYLLRGHRLIEILRAHKKLFMITVVSLVVVATGLHFARDTYVVQNVIFHADSSTTLEDPNELRLRFWQESLDAFIAQPFGHGVGTAGLASIRNTEQGTVLTENYYLQILYEVGLFGLVLFLAILSIVAYLLYAAFKRTGDVFSLALFAAFFGLLFTNFLVHIWANEAVAYTFWGLAGLCIARIRVKAS